MADDKFHVETYVGLGDVAHNGGVIDRREQVGREVNDAQPIGPSNPTSTSIRIVVFYNAGSHAFDHGRIFGPAVQPR